jgi:hypothetical protein
VVEEFDILALGDVNINRSCTPGMSMFCCPVKSKPVTDLAVKLYDVMRIICELVARVIFAIHNVAEA